MKKEVKKRSIIAALVSVLVVIILFVSLKNNYFATLLSVCFVAFIILSCNYEKNILMLIFLICFFVFLIGRPFVIEVMGYSRYSAITLSEETKNQLYSIMTISLISVLFGYYVSKHIKLEFQRKQKLPLKDDRILSIRNISKNMSIFLYVFSIIENIMRLVFIKHVGYTASYTMDFDYGLPFGLHNLAIVAPVALMLFLATLPSKREVIFPLFLFLTSNLISSMAGNRFEIIACVLFLVVYGVWRSAIGEKSWITSKHLLYLVLLMPIVVSLLQSMVYWRDNIESDNNVGPIIGFMYGTGGSSDVIGAVIQYGDLATRDDVLYSFGGIWRSLNGNAVSRFLGVGKSYKVQTIEYANEAHSLGASITYYFHPRGYLSGYGLGSSYIAELYHDFSTIGVVVGNILIGLVIGLFGGLKKGRIIINYLCLFLVVLLLRLPRDSFDYPFISLVSLKNIFMFVIILLIANRARFSGRIKAKGSV